MITDNKEQELKRKFLAIIDQITYAVADSILSQTSDLFKAAIEAKKLIEFNSNNENAKEVYTYPQYKWTQFGMLEHCLAVVKLIIEEKRTFPEACVIRAKEVRKTVPSIRQACCRALLDTKSGDWNNFANGNTASKNFIIEKLIKKYPTERIRILKMFNNIQNKKIDEH